MLVEDLIEVPITRRNVTYYKNLGYNTPKIGRYGGVCGTIFVKSNDVNPKSKVTMLDFICDCCGKEFQRTAESYYKRVNKTGFTTTYCAECYHNGAKETMENRYGYSWGGQIPEAKEKQKATCLERYGVPYVMQTQEFKEKAKNSCLDKYGVDSPAKRPEQRELSKRLFENNGLVSSSKGQRKICDLIGGQLNYKFHGFYLDALYEDWLDVEYDGSGHNLRVRNKFMTQDEFDKQERRRYAAIHSFGLKTLTIIGNDKDILPDDEQLYDDIIKQINFLKDNDVNSAFIDYSKLC